MDTHYFVNFAILRFTVTSDLEVGNDTDISIWNSLRKHISFKHITA